MNVDIIGVPLDLGASRRGVDMGPSAIRYADLKKTITSLDHTYNDLGNINVPIPECFEFESSSKMKHKKEISHVTKKISETVQVSLEKGNFPIVLGGDHSIAAGTIMGVQTVFKNIGVIWIDAHADFNTEHSTNSGNMHGMPLAAVTGTGASPMVDYKDPSVNFVDPKKCVLIGVRDIDPKESELLKERGVNVFSMADIDMYGIRDIVKKALEIVENGTEAFHLSFDLDAVDPAYAPGVGTPVNGGLTYREANLMTELISESKHMKSAEMVELNPILDIHNQTGQLAVTLISSILGKKII